MKKMSKIVENKDSIKKNYKVKAEIELVITADNEGEAGYLSDSELGSLKTQYNFQVLSIDEMSDDEFDEFKELSKNNDNEDV